MPTLRSEGTAPSDRHLPAWLVERIAFEAEAADAASLGHQGACLPCRHAVERLRRERDGFLADRPATPFVAGVLARAAGEADAEGRPPPWWAPPRWLLATCAALASALLVLVLRSHLPREEVRLKGGGVALALFVSRGGEPARPHDPREPLRPGDVVRFGILVPAGGHAVVVSVDERGEVARYAPAQGEGGDVAPRDGLQILPGSVVLDAALGREWVLLVVSRTPLPAPVVEEAVRRAWQERRGDVLGAVPLDADVRVVAVMKVTP